MMFHFSMETFAAEFRKICTIFLPMPTFFLNFAEMYQLC